MKTSNIPFLMHKPKCYYSMNIYFNLNVIGYKTHVTDGLQNNLVIIVFINQGTAINTKNTK